jgi:hypothetical protein
MLMSPSDPRQTQERERTYEIDGRGPNAFFIDWLGPDGRGCAVAWPTLDRDVAAQPIDDQYVIDLELVCPLVEVAVRMFAPAELCRSVAHREKMPACVEPG